MKKTPKSEKVTGVFLSFLALVCEGMIEAFNQSFSTNQRDREIIMAALVASRISSVRNQDRTVAGTLESQSRKQRHNAPAVGTGFEKPTNHKRYSFFSALLKAFSAQSA